MFDVCYFFEACYMNNTGDRSTCVGSHNRDVVSGQTPLSAVCKNAPLQPPHPSRCT